MLGNACAADYTDYTWPVIINIIITINWLHVPAQSPEGVVLCANDKRDNNKDSCSAAHKKGLRHLKQKSAFNLFSDKEKPFTAWFLLVLFHLKRSGGLGVRVGACVCGDRDEKAQYAHTHTQASSGPCATVCYPRRRGERNGGGWGVINADWLIALETDRSCARIVLEQWSVPDWHFPPTLLRFLFSTASFLLSLPFLPLHTGSSGRDRSSSAAFSWRPAPASRGTFLLESSDVTSNNPAFYFIF